MAILMQKCFLLLKLQVDLEPIELEFHSMEIKLGITLSDFSVSSDGKERMCL